MGGACGILVGMGKRIGPLLILLAIALPAAASVNSLFINGLSFYDTGDFDRSAEDIRAADLSPGYDGDFLLTFRNSKRTSVLAGFGIFWSRRTEDVKDIPFSAPTEKSTIEAIGFPFTVGFACRDPENRGRRGWVWGAMAHYYLIKVSVNADPGLGYPSWFSLNESGEGARDGAGPGLSAFAAYEVPFFLGRIGAGIKARWTSLAIDEEAGIDTPGFDLTGVSIFLSLALN